MNPFSGMRILFSSEQRDFKERRRGDRADRAGIDTVYGESDPTQRCRNPKIGNAEGVSPKTYGIGDSSASH